MSKIGICGISGRMGTSIYRVLGERSHDLGAAFDAPSAPRFGKDAASLIGVEDSGVIISSIDEEGMRNVDGIIDFSAPVATLKLVELAREFKKPVVIGTTGLSEKDLATLQEASSDIPLLTAPNMSLGVNLFFKIVELASRAIPEGYDLEIFEAHHHFKKDAPSGTARKMIDIVKENTKRLSNGKEVHGREGIVGERQADEIGVHAMRGGDIVGEHTIFYNGIGERIEITHRATDRVIFARGAVQAMEFLIGKAPGYYSMNDVLGL